MATYKTGTVNVTNGNATVAGVGTSWVGQLHAGDYFTVAGDNISYIIASDPVSNTSLTLSAPYGGATGTGKSYEVNRDKTIQGIPTPQRGDLEPYGVLAAAFAKIDGLLYAVTGGAYAKQPLKPLLTSLAALTIAAGDLIYGSGANAMARLAKGTDGQALIQSGGLPAWGNLPNHTPQGRLALTSGVPVPTSDVPGATTIYYTPFRGNLVPLYDGTRYLMVPFTELSQALSNTTKSPAASIANKNYDLFVWNDGGTLRCTRGPAWTSDTARGTGAGTTEINRIAGLWLNKNDITNGPLANRGTYVGTIRTNAANAVPMLLAPAAASGGTANLLYCWNAYNRVPTIAICRESANSWTYTAATIRSMNGSAANSISYVAGLAEGFLEAQLAVTSASSNGSLRYALIGYNATNAMAAGCLNEISGAAANILAGARATLGRAVDIGLNAINALEYSVASGTTTWYGTNATSSVYQAGLSLKLDM